MTQDDTPVKVESETDHDAVIVGAGFSGLYMLHRLRKLGLSARIIEKAPDVGGTWYWNRYPGARCDSESHIYCYSFSDEILDDWEWSERYPGQAEILEYLRFVADRLSLRSDIDFETTVESATFNDSTGIWEITTDSDTSVSAQYFITAVGCLSKPYIPDLDGIADFAGEWYHTAKWPHTPVDFEGKDVAVIGTGSTGIQAIPKVANRAERLTVFQRTANYAVPAHNRPLTPDRYKEIRESYDEIWRKATESSSGMPFEYAATSIEELSDDEIQEILEDRWGQGGFRFTRTFEGLLTDPEINEIVSEFIRSKIRGQIEDPDLVEKLLPTDHPYGAKRPPLDFDDYFKTYEQDHVQLVDANETPIEKLTPAGIQTSDTEYAFDIIIFATGFDAMTGAILDMDITGRNGLTLERAWENGPRTYLGLMVHGFPNMFTITGPQSPSVLTNMPVAIEQHVDWIADCIDTMKENSVTYIEPRADAEAKWVEHTNEVADQTLFTEADSWYRGANVPGKTRTFLPYPGGLDVYRSVCADVASADYDGFAMADSIPVSQ